MALEFVDKLLDGLDDLRRGLRGWTKADPSQYYPFACAHSQNVLGLYNGSLVSVIELNGYMGQYIPDQFELLKTQWMKFLRNNAGDKTAKGCDIFWSYEFDPEGMADFTAKAREPMIVASARRGLDTRDIIEEEAQVYGKICAREKQFLIVVTHLDALTKADHKDARNSNLETIRRQPKGQGSILLGRGLQAIESLHEQHVLKLTNFLSGAGFGYTFQRMDAYRALNEMRHALIPATTSKGWRARLTLKDARFNRPTERVTSSAREKEGGKKPLDWTFAIPPSLAEQMTPDGIIDLGRYVVIGDRTYAPMYVDELANDPEPLEKALLHFYNRKLPIRIMYSLMANSDQANYWNRMLASAFTFASPSNRQINKADKAMKAYKEAGGAVLGFGMSITTWAPTEITYKEDGSPIIGVKNIQRRVQDVESLLQQWGGQQVSNVFGCAVEGVMSATPGYMIPPTCPLSPQIEADVLTQLPLMRPAKLWDEKNAIWFRTEDGVLSPYQPMSAKQNAMLTLIMGGMGFGKSNLISEHLFYFANHPEADDMPYIRGIDFGSSASGVVDIVKASLPPERQHEAIFESFTNDGSLVKNLHDTRLGCRYPLSDHKAFLCNFYTLICDELIRHAGGVQTIMAILDAAIDRVYTLKDDRDSSSAPALYRHDSSESVVREMVEKYEIEYDEQTTSWDIVDALMAAGLQSKDDRCIYAAKVAQRLCSPQLKDMIQACSQLASEFQNAVEIQGKPLTAAISGALQNANKQFPCISGVTKTDISEARVCVFDMTSAFGRGSGAAEDYRRSVYFAVAYRLLNEDLFVNKRDTGVELERGKDGLGLSDRVLEWHLDYLERQDRVIKMFWADELHRIGTVEGAFAMIDSMALEGRKYRVGIMLGTQMPENFPPKMLALASSIFIFGASQSSQNALSMQKLFDLTDTERDIIAGITKPNTVKGAEVFAINKVDTRIQRIKLHFNIGLIKLWGYATESDERAIRGILYKRGPSSSWARKTLAKKVPNLKQLISSRAEAYGDTPPPNSELLEALAEELLNEIRD